MKEKICFKCGAKKPLTDFYKHPMMADGYVNKCKECNKRDVKENRAAKVEYYQAYDAMRFKSDPKVRGRHKRYQQTEDGKASIKKCKERWIEQNPEARAAHIILGNAVRAGRLVKPDTCSKCGDSPSRRNIHAHHEDYKKPVDVTWLCSLCHYRLHNPEK